MGELGDAEGRALPVLLPAVEGLAGAPVQIEALAGEDVVVDRLLAERMPEGDQLAVAFAAEDALVERLPERRGEGGRGELADLGKQLVVSGPADDRERADRLIGI